MTSPRRGDSNPLAPVRRRGAAPAPAEPAFDNAEVARGQSDALLGALGRMQLRLDLLAREQADAFAALNARLDALEGKRTDPPA